MYELACMVVALAGLRLAYTTCRQSTIDHLRVRVGVFLYITGTFYLGLSIVPELFGG